MNEIGKYLIRTTGLASLLVVLVASAAAQAQGGAQERAANLHAQLTELEAKQTELQTRMQQLDEALKPENIEKSLAGVGSTHPEELREQRRRQLEIQKTALQTQLDQLAASRTRLEAAAAQADADAYHASAGVNTGGPQTYSQAQTNSSPTQYRSTRPKKHRAKKRRVPKPAVHQ